MRTNKDPLSLKMMMTYLLAIEGIKVLNLQYFQTLIKPRKHENLVTSPTDGYYFE